MKYVPFDRTNMYLPEPMPAEITYGFYLPGNEKPAEISLDESWATYKGYYFFLHHAVASTDTAVLVDLQKGLAAEPFLQDPLHTGACWWDNTERTSAVHSLLQTTVVDGNAIVHKHVNIGFGTYQLPLFADAPLVFRPEGVLFSGYPAVEGTQPASVANGVSLAVAGDKAGILAGQVMINDFSNNGPTGWSAGFRYNMMANGKVSQYYPIFNQDASTYWVFDLLWDPLHPLDSRRSQLAFTGISFGLQKIDETEDRFQIFPGSAELDSWLRTIYGQPISLQPVTAGADPAQLVFQTYADPQKSPAYYLAPKGTFVLQATPDNDSYCRLLPGLSGTESIRFTPGDEIVFYPDNAAYAGGGLAGTELDTTFTASWAFIKAASGEPAIYSSAPGVASLYQQSETSTLLDAYYAAAAQLPAEGSIERSFPLVPYAGLNRPQANAFTQDQVAGFESRLLSAYREKRMATMPVPENLARDDAPVTTTTRQGLLATIAGLAWNEVLLAKNTELPVDFRFTNLPTDLRNAFQSEDLFLVISDAAHIGTFDDALSIEGWQFNVHVPLRDPEQDPAQKNILLLKFRKGALINLVQDTTQWTDPVNFNYNADQVLSTQTWLNEYCNEAMEMATSNPQFNNFKSIIEDPEWYGILALRTDINVGNFPQDLRGLLGAMDLKRFYAHHVGVQVNFVEQNGDQPPEVKKSNLFALISYIDPAYQQNQGGTADGGQSVATFTADQNSVEDEVYAYKVLTLQVAFENSALTNFNSKLELTARKWFEEPGTLNVPGKGSSDDPANYSMIFNGRYENHDGHRTYTFLTQQGLTYQYFLTSNVLHNIEFVKAQFQTTASTPSAEPGTDEVTTRFAFYGFLNFSKQENFDCFSYGSEKEQELQKGRGLYFSNLVLDVAFSLHSIDHTTSGLTIKLNPGNVSFDQSMSTMRQKSFAASFPISPTAILHGVSDRTPKKLGYLQVMPPVDFSTAGLQTTWYAINFDMHWGGPGALASQAGFVPQLMLAWSPGTGSVNVGIFLQLPGSGGGNAFSIQNVLKLSAGPFQLKQVPHGDDKISYNFFLLNLSLSLFGIKLPPMGNTNLVLIGDAEQPGTLGWYGAYINK